jgi:hypothetical protein
VEGIRTPCRTRHPFVGRPVWRTRAGHYIWGLTAALGCGDGADCAAEVSGAVVRVPYAASVAGAPIGIFAPPALCVYADKVADTSGDSISKNDSRCRALTENRVTTRPTRAGTRVVVKLNLTPSSWASGRVRAMVRACTRKRYVGEGIETAYVAAAAASSIAWCIVAVGAEGIVKTVVLQIKRLIRSKSVRRGPGIITPMPDPLPNTMGNVYEIYAVATVYAGTISYSVVVSRTEHIVDDSKIVVGDTDSRPSSWDCKVIDAHVRAATQRASS